MRPKTKEEKEMQGTYEPSKEGLEPVEYDSYQRVPVAPQGWPPQAQKIWSDRCNDLKTAGYLLKAVMPALRRYCFAVYMADVAEKRILEDGEDAFIAKYKWMAILSDNIKIIERLGAKFGFTPLDSIKIPKIVKEKATMSLLK